MQNGTIPECLTSQCVNNINKLGMDEVELAYAVSSPFGAGIETVSDTVRRHKPLLSH